MLYTPKHVPLDGSHGKLLRLCTQMLNFVSQLQLDHVKYIMCFSRLCALHFVADVARHWHFQSLHSCYVDKISDLAMLHCVGACCVYCHCLTVVSQIDAGLGCIRACTTVVQPFEDHYCKVSIVSKIKVE